MKILFHGYNTCCQNDSGGIQVRMRKIAELLINKNVQVDFFNPFETHIKDYDIIHFFKPGYENYELILCAKRLKKKIVISSVIQLVNGWKIDFFRRLMKLPISTVYKLMIKSYQMADLIIAETYKEAMFLQKHFKIAHNKIVVIPNGIDKRKIDDKKDIFTVLGKNTQYVLQVGRFDKNKNQMTTIKALKNSNIDVVFVGGPDHTNSDYYDKCVSEAKGYSNIHFLGWIDNKSGLLDSAYANAKVVVVPSFQETFGMVILEAGIFGANLVISNTIPIVEFEVFKDCRLINPSSVKELRTAVKEEINHNKNFEFAEKIKSYFSWDRLIDSNIDIYKDLMNE